MNRDDMYCLLHYAHFLVVVLFHTVPVVFCEYMFSLGSSLLTFKEELSSLPLRLCGRSQHPI